LPWDGDLRHLKRRYSVTVTVARIDGGKLRCTGATWADAVVIYPERRRWPL
jgi:hypothetical protein